MRDSGRGRLVFRVSERPGNTGIAIASDRRSAWLGGVRMDAHQLLEPFDFGRFQENASLPGRPSLEVVDGDPLAAEDK